jgi:hydroxypyruvate reductase
VTRGLERLRADAQDIFLHSLKPVDPYQAVNRFVRVKNDVLEIGPLDEPLQTLNLADYRRVVLVGGGKASSPMARALEDLLGPRISTGLVNVKAGFTEPLEKIELIEAEHPVPGAAGVAGTRRMIEKLCEAGERDLVFSVISGGGSALLPSPAGGITLEEKQSVTRKLLECGAVIDEINAVRKHISTSKGGQMARAAFPATTVNLMLSDVVGDKLDVIASGPFTPDSSTFDHVLQIFRKYNLKDIPAAVLEYIKAGVKGRVPETPKAGDPIFEKVHNIVVGSNILACRAAEEKARALGYNTLILSSMIEGEARDVALVHAGIAKEILASGLPLKKPACIISGGETTVTIKGKGLGGRNMEFALAAAIHLENSAGPVVILSGGTDGNDGPTDAAGAFADPTTVERGKKTGVEATEYLAANNSYHFFEKTGDLLITGPTKTNVMDVRLVLVG